MIINHECIITCNSMQFLCSSSYYETQEIAKLYGAVCTPDPFLFDSNKTLVFHGRINDAIEPGSKPQKQIMQENIKKILNAERIEKDFDPSIGCSIKWKE